MSDNNQDLIAMINQLKAQNAALVSQATAKKTKGASIRVSAKGAVSVYGLGRFPVTLYDTQWTKLFGMIEDVKAFLEANKEHLAKKPE